MNPLAAPYFYGLDEPLPADLVESYVKALVCVARANGIVESESRVIQGAAEILGAMPFTVSRALAGSADLGPALAPLREHASLMTLLYRDALLVVRADGVTTSEEEVTLMQMATQLGLSKAQREAATKAADMLSDLRQAMKNL